MVGLTVTRRSAIHGNGVFAAKALPAGIEVMVYAGRLRTHAYIDRVYANTVESGHTFLFTLNERYVIDANVDGNDARWINHSCEPNCKPYVIEDPDRDPKRDRIVIETMREIADGEELTFDYGIKLVCRHTARMKQIWACRCGAPTCTGTMLKPKR
jgi:SET domain-containing protein